MSKIFNVYASFCGVTFVSISLSVAAADGSPIVRTQERFFSAYAIGVTLSRWFFAVPAFWAIII